MTKHTKKSQQGKSVWLMILILMGLSLVVALLLRDNDVILFNPKGLIADEQYRLLVVSTLIMLGFGIPVVGLLYFFAWKYREDNEKATYKSDSNHGKFFTFTIWALPTALMLILAAIMLPATQKLEPQKPIESDKDLLTIQVVAMRWKWLFIYPEQKVATVNYVHIPEDTPVQFELTADETPMSSFWIPHLGGMLYAMTEHVNRLNLMAEEVGDYEGSAAEINGSGFAGMRFNTHVGTEEEFQSWIKETSDSNGALTEAEYQKLLKPSENHPVTFYSSPSPEIYSKILSKYAGSHNHDAAPTHYEGGH